MSSSYNTNAETPILPQSKKSLDCLNRREAHLLLPLLLLLLRTDADPLEYPCRNAHSDPRLHAQQSLLSPFHPPELLVEFDSEVELHFERVAKPLHGVEKHFQGIDKLFQGVDKPFQGADKCLLVLQREGQEEGKREGDGEVMLE